VALRTCYPCLVRFKIGQNANLRELRNLWYVDVDLVVLGHVMGKLITVKHAARDKSGVELV
jgi:hypothetical protein